MIFKNDIDKITKYDKQKTDKKNNYTFLNENYCKENQIVLFGDSITELYNWYELFYDYCKENNTAIYNRGISGDTSDRLLERLYCNALNINPSKIIILIGTNDFRPGLSMSFTVNNIDKMLTEIEKTCPQCKIILEAVYPVNKNIDKYSYAMVGRRKNDEIIELNKMIKSMSQKHNITYLDLWDILISPDGTLKKDYTIDGLHLNAKGFSIVTDELLKIL